jgi:excisionase family DNA binding protein
VQEDDILTIRDVAALLKIGEKTTYSMAQTGELPGFKVGGQWRFQRGDLKRWVEAQKVAVTAARRR